MPPKGSRVVKEDADSRSDGSSINTKNAGSTRGGKRQTNGVGGASSLRDTVNDNDLATQASAGSNAVCFDTSLSSAFHVDA